MTEIKKCPFDNKTGYCTALACFDSTQKCSCRDNKGNPKYSTLKKSKKNKLQIEDDNNEMYDVSQDR